MNLSQTYLTTEKTTTLISTDQMKKQIVILGWHKETPVNKATGDDQGIKG